MSDEPRGDRQADDEPVVIEAERDTEASDRPAIDPPPDRHHMFRTLWAASTAQRRPIVPAYLRDWHDAKSAARFIARHGAHVGLYHLTRSPKYALRLGGRAPRGAGRTVASTWAWALNREGAPLRRAAVDRSDTSGYLALTRERNARVKRRGGSLAAGLVTLATRK